MTYIITVAFLEDEIQSIIKYLEKGGIGSLNT